jgi:hypothetical protein
MASALDWLNQATAALSDTRKETMEWEKKRRETDDQLNIYKRVGSVAEVDKNLSSKHAELSMLTSSAKARAQAALELVKASHAWRRETGFDLFQRELAGHHCDLTSVRDLLALEALRQRRGRRSRDGLLPWGGALEGLGTGPDVTKGLALRG